MKRLFLGVVVDGYAFVTLYGWDALDELEEQVRATIEAESGEKVVVHPDARVFMHPNPDDALTKGIINDSTALKTRQSLQIVRDIGWKVELSPFKLVNGHWHASAEDVNFANQCSQLCGNGLRPIGAVNAKVMLDHLVIVTADKDHTTTLKTSHNELRWLVYLGEGRTPLWREARNVCRLIEFSYPRLPQASVGSFPVVPAATSGPAVSVSNVARLPPMALQPEPSPLASASNVHDIAAFASAFSTALTAAPVYDIVAEVRPALSPIGPPEAPSPKNPQQAVVASPKKHVASDETAAATTGATLKQPRGGESVAESTPLQFVCVAESPPRYYGTILSWYRDKKGLYCGEVKAEGASEIVFLHSNHIIHGDPALGSRVCFRSEPSPKMPSKLQAYDAVVLSKEGQVGVVVSSNIIKAFVSGKEYACTGLPSAGTEVVFVKSKDKFDINAVRVRGQKNWSTAVKGSNAPGAPPRQLGRVVSWNPSTGGLVNNEEGAKFHLPVTNVVVGAFDIEINSTVSFRVDSKAAPRLVAYDAVLLIDNQEIGTVLEPWGRLDKTGMPYGFISTGSGDNAFLAASDAKGLEISAGMEILFYPVESTARPGTKQAKYPRLVKRTTK